MSTANFVVYNDAGKEQISFAGINLQLINKVTVPSAASWTQISGPLQTGLKYSFNISAKKPIIAIATSSGSKAGAVFPVLTKTGANAWRVDIYGCASQTTVTSQPGANQFNAAMKVYVFDEALAPTSGPGLALYDPTGKCVFNALYPPMRVKQMLDDADNINGYGTRINVPSNKTYAFIMRSNWGQQIIGSRNAFTGDMLANEFRYGFAGGYPSTALVGGNGVSGDYFLYPCFINGSIAVPHGSPGTVGNTYATFGCNNGQTYFSDALIIDVTNL